MHTNPIFDHFMLREELYYLKQVEIELNKSTQISWYYLKQVEIALKQIDMIRIEQKYPKSVEIALN